MYQRRKQIKINCKYVDELEERLKKFSADMKFIEKILLGPANVHACIKYVCIK